MRLVLDTNVLVSAFLWKGKPGRLIELAGEGEIELFTTRALLGELSTVLRRRKFLEDVRATGLGAAQMVLNYRRLATVVAPRKLGRRVSRDRSDDRVLACALGAHADLVVSGDADLIAVGKFRGLRIARPDEALEVISTARGAQRILPRRRQSQRQRAR